MRGLPLLICGSVIGGAAGWHSGEAARSGMESSAAGRARAEALTPPARPGVSKLNAVGVKARLDVTLASTAVDSSELQLLMARWVAVDLEGAKAWMHAHYDNDALGRETGEQPLTCFFKAWAALDPAAAMDEALASKFGRGETAKRAVVASLARADIQTMTAVLQKLKPFPADYSDTIGVSDLLRQLTVRDPAAAKALALQLKGSLASAAIIGVAGVWARTDPQAALTWVEQSGNSDPRQRASTAILTEWARRDPAAVGPFLLKKTLGQPDRFCAEAAAEAVARISAADPAEAMAFAEKFIPPDQLKSGLSELYSRLLVNDGDAPQSTSLLCRLVGTLPVESLKEASLFKGGWPSNEILQTTWDSLLSEPGSPARTFLLGQIGQQLAYGNTERFLTAVMRWPDEGLRDEVLEKALSLQRGFTSQGNEDRRAGLQALAATVETLPEKVRPLGALKLAWSTVTGDPQASAAVIAKYPAIADKENLVTQLAKQFVAQADPAAAQAWSATLPTETSRALAYGGIATAWYAQDSNAASRWVDSLPPGPSRDEAAASLALEAVADDPAAAFAWASSVQDTAGHADSAKNVIRRWARSDWQAASVAVEQSSLPAEQKTALQNEISRWR